MSIIHSLALYIPETSVETTLVIQDHSAYADLATDGRQLEIWIPGFSDPILILEADLSLGFSLNVTAILLGIQNLETSVPSILPDGLYRIKYSISSAGSNIEYYHLRTSRLLNLYNRELCKIHFQNCEPSKEEKETLDQLRLIRMYFDGAKAKAEYCHAPNQGLEILAYAEKMLMKFVFKGCAGGDCQPCSNCSPCTTC
jgi:hypothetical protein